MFVCSTTTLTIHGTHAQDERDLWELTKGSPKEIEDFRLRRFFDPILPDKERLRQQQKSWCWMSHAYVHREPQDKKKLQCLSRLMHVGSCCRLKRIALVFLQRYGWFLHPANDDLCHLCGVNSHRWYWENYVLLCVKQFISETGVEESWSSVRSAQLEL